MSTINKKVNISNASNLLNNPNIIVLATKDKLILNDININLSDESKNLIASKIISGVDVLNVEKITYNLADVDGNLLADSEGYLLTVKG